MPFTRSAIDSISVDSGALINTSLQASTTSLATTHASETNTPDGEYAPVMFSNVVPGSTLQGSTWNSNNIVDYTGASTQNNTSVVNSSHSASHINLTEQNSKPTASGDLWELCICIALFVFANMIVLFSLIAYMTVSSIALLGDALSLPPKAVRYLKSRVVSCYPREPSFIKIIAQGQTFNINSEGLKKRSRYFQASLKPSSHWLEQLSGVVQLEGFEAELVGIFKKWIDTEALDPNLCAKNSHTYAPWKTVKVPFGNKKKIFQAAIPASIGVLIDCYLLGDYLDAPGFQNDIISELFKHYSILSFNHNGMPLHNVDKIYQNTSSASPILHFILDGIDSCLSKTTLLLAIERGLISDGLAIIIMGNLMELRGKGIEPRTPWSSNPCPYHRHPQGSFNSPCRDPYPWISSAEQHSWDYFIENPNYNFAW